jgi:glucose-6-phosphate isomerase
MSATHLRDLFARNPKRFEQFSLRTGEILFDYSKNLVDSDTMQLLHGLARECGLPKAIEAMFNGEQINATEGRAVLHTALRNLSGGPVMVNGSDVMPEIRAALDKMRHFCHEIHSGSRRGYTGKKIRTIVNIGIGGSDLGPMMVTEALRSYRHADMQVHFVSNLDGTHIM